MNLPEAYFHSTYQAYGIKKPSASPPDLRKILDDGLESQQTPLTPEASSRYRSAVGKIAWGAQTRVDPLTLLACCPGDSLSHLPSTRPA